MPNRLVDATSPYLLQHKDNPVDWQEWGPAAFEEARRRDVPILLSVGYSACHWCHVMAHESFEDEQVAQAINGGFVAVKVDREERPDIDAIYMNATTAMTGQGGWPMTCLLTPGGEPFFCGTYLPKPQLLQLLAAVGDAWSTRREEVLASGSHIAQALRSAVTRGPAVALGDAELAGALAQLSRSFDATNGGFGRAPKFPPSMVLEFLLRHHARTGSETALRMVEQTCEAMARGGMYDQLGGGFARYSVDERWVVPHFEKMLYDNALLLRVYLHLWRATGSPLAGRVARETADFLLRDLLTPEGGFAAALDADTDGVEGLTYAWSPRQLVDVLGADEGERAARLLSATPTGTFEGGMSTLQLREDPTDPAWWARTRERLLRARAARPQPGRDDKVVTAWNGLAVGALAEAGALLDEPRYLAAATRCAELHTERHLVDGRLRRSSRGGVVGQAAAVAEDHGDLAEGLLALHQATGDPRWLRHAGVLLDVALEHFAAEDGGFHDTADDGEQLFTRPRGEADNAEPSGQSALAGALLTWSALTGSPRHRRAADGALAAAGTLASREPRFAGWTLAVAEAALTGPLQVAVVAPTAPCPDEGPKTRLEQVRQGVSWTGERGASEASGLDELVRAARMSTSPGLVMAVGPSDATGVPLLADRPAEGGAPTAYVCRGFVCDRPVTSVAELRAALTR